MKPRGNAGGTSSLCSTWPADRAEPRNGRPQVLLRWLTERLGEVVLRTPAVEEIEAREPDELPVPASPIFVEHRIRDESGCPHEPVRAGVIRCDFGVSTIPTGGSDWPSPDDRVVPREPIESQESFPDDDWDFDEIEERLAIMTIDGGLTEAEARATLGLPSVPSL